MLGNMESKPMASTTLNFNKTLSLKQAARWVITCPKRRFHIKGPPGIGKSSMMRVFEEHFGDRYEYCYFDMGSADYGDIGVLGVDREFDISKLFPNEIFKLHTGKPVVIMLDEFGKAPLPIQNMLHPLLEIRKPRLGNRFLPEGSIVVLFSNLATDNVGDNVRGHSINRVTEVEVRSPTSDEWIADFAIHNNVDPSIVAWVRAHPHCLFTYRDGEGLNEFGYNPKRPGPCVTPRSLEGASDTVKMRHENDNETLVPVLAGTVGLAAAESMDSFIAFQDQLPSWESITKTPQTADVPENPGACAVLVFGAIMKVDKNNFNNFMDYLWRMEPEWQSVFCINISKSKDKAKRELAFSSKKFTDWVRENEDLL
jgi:hypothetical protein